MMFTTEGSTALPTLRKTDDSPSTCDNSSRVASTRSSARANWMSSTSVGPKKYAPTVPPATASAANDFRNDLFMCAISLDFPDVLIPLTPSPILMGGVGVRVFALRPRCSGDTHGKQCRPPEHRRHRSTLPNRHDSLPSRP